MATIGLDKLYYAEITIGEDGYESYGTPTKLAEAMTAELSVEVASATLYADDKASEVLKEFTSGTLSLGVKDIGKEVASILLGSKIDSNGAVVSSGGDDGKYVAIGFRALKPNKKYRYFWLYKVKFGIPTTSLTTKGESIEFATPTIEGTIMQRNKPDADGRFPWKAEITEGESEVSAETISSWYTEVYEPTYTSAVQTNASQAQITSATSKIGGAK